MLDDLRIAEHPLEVADPRLHQRLFVLRGVVLRVLTDVAVLASGLEPFGDVRPARGRQLVELAPQTQVRVEGERGRGLLSRLPGGAIGQLRAVP